MPGVRELFEEAPPQPPRKNRGDLMKDIDAYYYGYLDDEDGVLLKLEVEVEKKGLMFLILLLRIFCKHL